MDYEFKTPFDGAAAAIDRALPKHLKRQIVNCPKHGETWQLLNTKTNQLMGCPKCEMEKEEDARNIERKMHLVNIAKIPGLFDGKTFQDYQVENDSQKRAKSLCKLFADQFAQYPERCLVLIGGVGTGKTHLGIAVLRQLLEEQYYCRYTNVSQLFSSVKATYGDTDPRTESEVIESYIRPAMLMIDELGLTALSKTEQHILYQVIDGRYTNRKGTIVATNLSAHDLKENVGERIIDRLREHSEIYVEMQHRSHRA